MITYPIVRLNRHSQSKNKLHTNNTQEIATKMPQSAKTYALFVLLAFLSLLPNLGEHEFKNEESLRTIIAYEMQASGDYIQPTYLGEEYYKKPPMYTWLTVLSANFTGWNELASRMPSVVSYLLICIFIFLFARTLFKNAAMAALASLIFAVTVDVIFFYGFVGEIDGTFSLTIFVVLASMVLAFERQQYQWLLVAGLSTSVAFMLKGFPAFVFFGLTLLTLIFLYKRFNLLKNPLVYISSVLCLALPAIWLLSTINPQASFHTLFSESADRTKESLDVFEFLKHLIVFPLQLFIKLLPGSLFLFLPLIYLWLKRKNKILTDTPFSIEPLVKILIIVTLINFIPYWISVGARGRYVLPLLPFFAIIAAYIIHGFTTPIFKKRLLQTAAVIIALRFVFGFVVIPIVMAQKGIESSDKKVAIDIMSEFDLNNRIVACDCTAKKAVCLYINIEQNRVLKTRNHTDPNWEYLLSCEKVENFPLLKSYNRGKHDVFLYKQSAQ